MAHNSGSMPGSSDRTNKTMSWRRFVIGIFACYGQWQGDSRRSALIENVKRQSLDNGLC